MDCITDLALKEGLTRLVAWCGLTSFARSMYPGLSGSRDVDVCRRMAEDIYTPSLLDYLMAETRPMYAISGCLGGTDLTDLADGDGRGPLGDSARSLMRMNWARPAVLLGMGPGVPVEVPGGALCERRDGTYMDVDGWLATQREWTLRGAARSDRLMFRSVVHPAQDGPYLDRIVGFIPERFRDAFMPFTKGYAESSRGA